MIRLFVGLELPDLLKQQLILAMGGLAGVRWQTPDQLHLTVRFIGEVDGHQARDIDSALAALRQQPVRIALAGLGLFEERGRPQTLWAGVAPEAPLKALHAKVDQALVRAGLAPERRAYKPHITLARLKARIGGLDVYIAGAGALRSDPVQVQQLCLFRSMLTSGGAHYDIIARYPFAGRLAIRPATPCRTRSSTPSNASSVS